jgi:hypothetical protein
MVRQRQYERGVKRVPSGICRSGENKTAVLPSRNALCAGRLLHSCPQGGIRNKCGGGLTDKGKLV